VFDRLVRALGMLPNDPDERKDAGDGPKAPGRRWP